MSKKFECLGKNAEVDGKVYGPGDVVADERDLEKMFPGKFRNLKKKAAKKVVADEEDDTAPGELGGIDVGKDAEEAGGKEEEEVKAPVKKRKKAADAEEEYVEVTKDFPEAKKADLAVFEYKSGEFQIFDADAKDDPDAKPVNDVSLRTSKKVKEFIGKYHS